MKKTISEKAAKAAASIHGRSAWSRQGREKMIEHMKKVRAARWLGKTDEEKKAQAAKMRAGIKPKSSL